MLFTRYFINGLVHLLEQRAHNPRFKTDGAKNDRYIHDLRLLPFPPVTPSDLGQRLEGFVPVPLAQLHVFKVELDEGAAMPVDEV